MTSETEFLLNVDSIRPKTLRKFLKIYFYAYSEDCQDNNPLITKSAREFMQRHNPRVFPGLRIIQRYLGCSKATASDYLRTVNITHEILAKLDDSQETQLAPIGKSDFQRLLWDLSPNFDKIAKSLKFKKYFDDPQAIRLEIRESLLNAAETISEKSCALASKECAQIIRELANSLL